MLSRFHVYDDASPSGTLFHSLKFIIQAAMPPPPPGFEHSEIPITPYTDYFV